MSDWRIWALTLAFVGWMATAPRVSSRRLKQAAVAVIAIGGSTAALPLLAPMLRPEAEQTARLVDAQTPDGLGMEHSPTRSPTTRSGGRAPRTGSGGGSQSSGGGGISADSVADPSLLPDGDLTRSANASTNYPYTDSLANMAAYASAIDTISDRKVYKVTSPTVPVANTTCSNEYGNGPTVISQPWARGDSTLYSIYYVCSTGARIVDVYYVNSDSLVFENDRAGPALTRPLSFTFSLNPATPRMAFALEVEDGVACEMNAYNTATNAIDNSNYPNLPHQPSNVADMTNCTWFMGDIGDNRFRWEGGDGAVVGVTVDIDTGSELHTYEAAEDVNEGYMDPEGDFTYLQLTGPPADLHPVRLSNDNDLGRIALASGGCVHCSPAANGYFFAQDQSGQYSYVHVGNPSDSLAVNNIGTPYSISAPNQATHTSCKWVMPNTGQGEGADQWCAMGPYTTTVVAADGGQCDRYICLVNFDGTVKLFVYTDTKDVDQDEEEPAAQMSPDGKLMVFNSAMGQATGSDRIDLFVALTPVSEAP